MHQERPSQNGRDDTSQATSIHSSHNEASLLLSPALGDTLFAKTLKGWCSYVPGHAHALEREYPYPQHP